MNIFSEYFKKRTLTSDFLKLDNPYYFNVVELLEQKETKAISKAPETNQFNYYIIEIPNMDIITKIEIKFKDELFLLKFIENGNDNYKLFLTNKYNLLFIA